MLKLGVVLIILLFVSPIGDSATKRALKTSSDTNLVVLQGSIVVNETQLHLVQPSILIPFSQSISIPVKTVDDFFMVNASLRINIVSNFAYHSNVVRYLKTIVIITRPGYSLFYRVIGRLINFNKTNVVSSGPLFVDVPLRYRATESDDALRVFIFAFGDVYHTHEVVDVSCHYFDGVDHVPPVTTCILVGNETVPC